MSNLEKIRIAIVDDNKECINELTESLLFIADVEICGTATKYKQALDLLLKEKPELVFLDVEMPCKNGFELLKEVREKGAAFSVIFYTAYDKYMIKALREQALDYILKPVDPEEIKNAIDRFRVIRNTQIKVIPTDALPNLKGNSEKIALPTYLGLQFLEKTRIVLFRCVNEEILAKPYWETLLIDSTTIRLSNHITAEKIMNSLPETCFFLIKQSCIINIAFLNGIVYKTRECHLMPPFDQLKLTASRTQFLKMKEIFDIF